MKYIVHKHVRKRGRERWRENGREGKQKGRRRNKGEGEIAHARTQGGAERWEDSGHSQSCYQRPR